MFKLLFNLFKQQIKITKNITEHYHIDCDEGRGYIFDKCSIYFYNYNK